MENPDINQNTNHQYIEGYQESVPEPAQNKKIFYYLPGGLIVLSLALGYYFVQQKPSALTSNNNVISGNPTITPKANTFDLDQLEFPSLPAGFSKSVIKDDSTSVVSTVYIEYKPDEVASPIIVAQISNWIPIDYENTNDKRSKFSEVLFLGEKYHFDLKQNTVHGDGPAVNQDGCSYSSTGDTHYIVSKEKVFISIDEITSSLNCDGNLSTEDTQPSAELIETIINIIENTKLK